MERTFRAMGTEWRLCLEDASATELDAAVALVTRLERRLSRFLQDSALSRLNRDRTVEDKCLAAVATEAERLRYLTAGSFDAGSGAAVIACGYDRSFEQIATATADPIGGRARRPQVVIEGARVSLRGEGALDLGGIAKGWAVQRAAELLSRVGPCFVDGGGDIVVRGRPRDAEEWFVGVGDGLAVGLRDAAVATSSTLRRRWRSSEGVAHHIVDPSIGKPAQSIASAVVVASLGAVADALATALVADPPRTLPALAVLEAEALLQRPDGGWDMTPGMERYLR